ncbi:glycosyltransferase [Hypoxylon sp. FL0543]|nr:glycosyltransferase [Hypoxylon sp. FL0543]
MGQKLEPRKTVAEGLVEVPREVLDSRSDAEIIASLTRFQPVVSEKNVWAFWDHGLERMKPWMRQNVINWVRRLGSSWTVRVTDVVPGSPNHVLNYVPDDYFPSAFLENRIDGDQKGQHASDLARLPLLIEHGGAYMDVGLLLFRNIDDICWAELQDPKSPFEICAFALQGREYFGQIINSFIAARKGNIFAKKWHSIYLHLWADRTNLIGVQQHPAIRHLGLLKYDDDPTFGDACDWEAFTDYASHALAYERLRLTKDPSPGGFDGAGYFQKHVFLLDAWSEMFLRQDEFDGDGLYEIFSTTYDLEKLSSGDVKQRAVEELCNSLLAKSCMAKFSSGFWQPGMPLPLTRHWADRENSSFDPMTWAGYLRHGSIHFEQLRYHGRCLPPLEIPLEKDTVHQVGLLEPVDEAAASHKME